MENGLRKTDLSNSLPIYCAGRPTNRRRISGQWLKRTSGTLGRVDFTHRSTDFVSYKITPPSCPTLLILLKIPPYKDKWTLLSFFSTHWRYIVLFRLLLTLNSPVQDRRTEIRLRHDKNGFLVFGHFHPVFICNTLSRTTARSLQRIFCPAFYR